MKLTTKVLIHYVVNLAIILSTIAILILTFSLKSGKSKAMSTTVPFVTMLLVTLLSLTITTLSLANNHNNPWRCTLPVILSSLLLTIIGTLIVIFYNSFFDNDSKYWTIFGTYPWKSMLVILLAIPFTLIFIIVNLYTTKFSLISVSGNIASEWTIKNTFALFINKANIKHCKEFSYLITKNKILIIRFNLEDEAERLIVFDEDERNQKSQLVLKIENKINELSSLNITINGAIVYLSNILPKAKGKSSNIFLWKNNELFNNFKKLEGKGNILIADLLKELD